MISALLALALANPDCVPGCPVTGTEGYEAVNLSVGTQKVLTVPGMTTYTLKGEGAEVKTIGKQLLVIGAARGVAFLDVESSTGVRRFKVRVKQLFIDECGMSPIYKVLPCEAGFDVHFEDDRVTVTGRFRTVAEWMKVQDLRQQHPGIAWPRVPKELAGEAVAIANQALQDAGLAVRVKGLGRGFVVSPADAATLAKAAAVLAPHQQMLRLTLSAPVLAD